MGAFPVALLRFLHLRLRPRIFFVIPLIISHFICQTNAVTAFHPLLHPGWPTNITSPTALRLRFYPSAIQYLNEIASDILAEQLPRIIIPNIYHRLSNDQGYISLKRVRVSRFRRAKLHNISVSEPNKVIWTMSGLNMWSG